MTFQNDLHLNISGYCKHSVPVIIAHVSLTAHAYIICTCTLHVLNMHSMLVLVIAWKVYSAVSVILVRSKIINDS